MWLIVNRKHRRNGLQMLTTGGVNKGQRHNGWSLHPVSAETVRSRERAIWTDVERLSPDPRAADAAKQPMAQPGVDRKGWHPSSDIPPAT